MNNDFHAIVLAAGKGSRMGTDIPKVLIPVCGRPMISCILDMLATLEIEAPAIVVGANRQMVMDALGGRYTYAVQEEQLGSGHAVMCAQGAVPADGNLLVLCGDSPLFRIDTISELMTRHRESDAVITLVSAKLDDPSGYGRILRNQLGSIAGIVEEKIATPEQKMIREVNGGCYAFDSRWLWGNIGLLSLNAVGEYCLTEMVDIAVAQGLPVGSVSAMPYEIQGVNTPDQLEYAKRIICGLNK